MADPITEQQLEDASTDADTLAATVNGDAGTMIVSREGKTYPTILGAIARLAAPAYANWAALAAVAPVQNSGSETLSGDTGTHVDPITGATVPNAGYFKAVQGTGAAPSGWTYVGPSQTDRAAASAILARAYSMGTADVDVPGGQPGDRPAQFWSTKAQAQVALATIEANLALGYANQALLNSNGIILKAYQTGILNDLSSVLARLALLENVSAISPAPWVMSAYVEAGGQILNVTVGSANSGSTFVNGGSYLRVWRAGFDDNGNPTVYPVQVPLIYFVRKPFPTSTLVNGSLVIYPDDVVSGSVATVRYWFKDYIYSSDALNPAIPGASGRSPELVLAKGWATKNGSPAPGQVIPIVNNSTKVSPPPFGNLITPFRGIIGNTWSGEIAAFHRNGRAGRQIACAQVWATDGTNVTPTVTVSATAVSPRTSDRAAAHCYPFTLDTSGLIDNHYAELRYNLVPFYGTATSIATNNAPVGSRAMSPRHMLKNVAYSVNRPVAYVDNATGNNSTGVCSTNAATAAASPFLTDAGATAACSAAYGTLDGLMIYGRAGAHVLTSPTTGIGPYNQHVAAVTYSRDPATTSQNSDVTWQFGAGWSPKFSENVTAPLTTAAIRFKDCTVQRNGVSTIASAVAGKPTYELIFDNVNFDNATANSNMLGTSNAWMYGVDFGTSLIGNGIAPAGTSATTGRFCITRGIKFDATGQTTANVEIYVCVASSFVNGAFSNLTKNGIPIDGGFIFCNSFPSIGDYPFATFGDGTLGSYSGNINGFAIAFNMGEKCNTNSANGVMYGLSNDSHLGSMTHFLKYNNTTAGVKSIGRDNAWYDETVGTPRTHDLCMSKNNITPSEAIKQDIFDGVNHADQNAGLHIGAWGMLNGVGRETEWFLTICGSTTGIQACPENYGYNTHFQPLVAGSQYYYTIDNPGFDMTKWKATTSTADEVYVAGAGGGDYRLLAGTPGRQMPAPALGSHGIDGVAMPLTTGSVIGCYG